MDNQNKLSVAKIFSEHMVLQREKSIPIWGTGTDGKEVVVQFRGCSYTTAVSGGKWSVNLPAMKAGRDDIMQITCEEEVIRIQNVAVGEVWLAGGQSNMEFYLRFDKEYKKALKKGENSDIFFFDYPEVSYLGQINEYDYSNFGFWRPCTKEHMEYYSAVAYYFAEKIQKKYHVPIGIVGCNWGGTTACCWMGEEYLRDNEGKIWLEEYQKEIQFLDMEKYNAYFAASALSYTGNPFGNRGSNALLHGIPKWLMKALIPGIEKAKDRLMPVVGPKSPWRPCGLYESMLKEVAPYGIRGVIWYQGESDDIHADVYETVLSQMICCWRDLWKEEIPFLLTQIAPLGFWFSGTPETYPVIREKQELVAKHVPGVWMTTIGDVGIEWDVHPKRKRPVGERLALLAFGHIYGEEILCDPPECIGMTVDDGKVTLKLKHADGGLIQKGKQVSSLECDRNGQSVESFLASAEGENIIISSEQILKNDRIQVRFAKKLYHEVNVFNMSGVPVRPFCIDNMATDI